MDMRFLFVIVALLASFSNLSAFALWEQPEGMQLFLQIQVRDSDGALITYIEGKPRIFDLDKLVQWLEPQSQKNIIAKNGRVYEIMRSSFDSDFSQTNTMGGYYIKSPSSGRVDYLMYMDHGSYHVQPGDVIKAYITLVRQL